MWESIKKDPILKTIVVAILGVFAFGLAFNIMFGSGNGGSEESSMMGSGYSLSNTLEVTIGLLIKLVVIAILIGIIYWIIQAIRKQIGGQIEFKNSLLLEDVVIRNTLLFAGFVLVFAFLFWIGKNTLSYGNGMDMMNQSYYPAYSIVAIVIFLIKLLVLALFASLGFSIIMYLKEVSTINAKKVNESSKMDHTKTSVCCPDCHATVDEAWKFCPTCGSDKAYKQTIK